jgi:hypothetical protein
LGIVLGASRLVQGVSEAERFRRGYLVLLDHQVDELVHAQRFDAAILRCDAGVVVVAEQQRPQRLGPARQGNDGRFAEMLKWMLQRPSGGDRRLMEFSDDSSNDDTAVRG